MIFMTQEKRSKKKPDFHRSNYRSLKRVKDKWRRPKGLQNKLRKQEKGKGSLPKIGYRNDKVVRGLVNGYEPVWVQRKEELSDVDKEKQGIIISKVGTKKYNEIWNEAKKLGLKILSKKRKVKK